MAVVWRATDLKLDRAVAVKVFRSELAEAIDPQRTARETHLLAGVDHPAVVGALDASTGDAPVTYLVMELVEGSDLKTLLTSGALDVDRTRRILADVAGALAVLHSRGVVHRDVKPANILVVDERERHRTGITAKLTDFGIAQAVDGTRITSSDLILGTAAYLSPEQVRGEAIGPASDVYSAGLVLAECLSGCRAFPGAPAEAAVARLHAAPPVPPEASPELAALLTAMTALDPADRPSASAVAATLRDLAGAMTAPDAEETARVPRPAPSMLAAAAAVPAVAEVPAAPFEDAVAIDDGGLSGGIPFGDDPDDDDLDDDPARARRPLLVPAIAALTIGLLGGVGALLSAPLLFGGSPTAHHAAAPAGSGAAVPPGDAVSADSPAPGPPSAGSAPSRLLKATHVAVPGSAPVAGTSGGSASGTTRSTSGSGASSGSSSASGSGSGASASASSRPSASASASASSSATPSPTDPPTSSAPPSPAPSPSATDTAAPTPSDTPTATPSGTPAPTASAPSTAAPTATPNATGSPAA
jgi:serine/threonine protein kinase